MTTDPIAPAPLARAEDAKRNRDLAGEVGVLMDADADLKRQPWLPLVAGDIVLMYLPGADAWVAGGRAPDYGVTYLAEDDGHTDPDTGAMLRAVSHTIADSTETLSLYDLWFEAGRDALTVIRAGAVVFGNPARAPERRTDAP